MSDYLPEEVVLEILHKLPVKSLVRCTSVCKSWNSLIKSPTFISTHFDKCKNPLLLTDDGENKRYSLYFDNQNLNEYKRFQFPRSDFGMYSSCNGLICLAKECYANSKLPTYILWNPIIHKFLILPQPSFKPLSVSAFHVLGLGYDSCTNDFKLLRIITPIEDEPAPHVEVFSLATGSWKNLTRKAPNCKILHFRNAFVNGFIHLLGFKDIRGSMFRTMSMIVGFDVGDEVFSQIMLPPSLANQEPRTLSLLVYKESTIAVLFYNPSILSPEIWVMKEYGVVESWTKLPSILEGIGDDSVPRPMGFRNNGEIILRISSDELLSYDLERRQIRNLGIRGFGVHTYAKSLVLLDRASDINEEIGDVSYYDVHSYAQ